MAIWEAFNRLEEAICDAEDVPFYTVETADEISHRLGELNLAVTKWRKSNEKPVD